MELEENDFPLVDTVDPSLLASTHHDVHIAPMGRDDLAFSLTLPKSWAGDPSSLAAPGDGSEWTPLAVFAAKPSIASESPSALPPSGISVVTVLWRRLGVEVPLAEWTACQVRGLQADITTLRMWSDAAGEVVDVGGTCVAVVGPSDSSTSGAQMPTALRAMVRSDGQDVFMVWGLSSLESYSRASRDLLVAGASFRLNRPPSPSGFETLNRAGAPDLNFEVLCPASWAHRALPPNVGTPGKSGLDMLLVKDEVLKGYVRIKAIDLRVVAVASMEALKQDAAAELAEANIQLLEAWEPISDPVILRTPDLEGAFIASGMLQDCTYEMHFGVVQRPPLLFCVTAMALPLNADAMMCLRGHRAYAMALATVRPKS